MTKKKHTGPKVLTFDIETAPLEGYVFGLRDQFLGPENLKEGAEEISLLSFAAKWLHEKTAVFFSTGGQKNVRDDKRVVKKLWSMLDEADVVITQNGKRFDVPVAQGRFAKYRLGLPSPFKHVDTCVMASKLGLPSRKLAYLTKMFAPELVKDSHNTFPGLQLWKECLDNNPKAWKVMHKYNVTDVLGTERVYEVLAPYAPTFNVNLYTDSTDVRCSCGSDKFHKEGFAYTPTGKYQIYHCLAPKCGKWFRGKENLFTKDKRLSLRGSA